MLMTQTAAFEALTATGSRTKSRGSNMAKVDSALKAYWDGIRTANPQQEIRLLNDLCSACLTWLKSKKDKSEFKTNFFGQVTKEYNELFIRRRNQITNLGNEAIAELFDRLQASGLLTQDLRGQISFNQKKLQTLSAPSTQRFGLRPMGQDYQPERGTYITSKKTTAISGSGVHSTHQNLNIYIKNGMVGELDAILGHTDARNALQLRQPTLSTRAVDARLQTLRSQIPKIAAKNVHNLSHADFKLLDDIGRLLDTTGDLNYLKKAERSRLLVTVNRDGKLCDTAEALITTGRAITAYAMDEYGNLFCKDAMPLHGARWFNHSSFNAGKDVICAGTLTIAAGQLLAIDNCSGHYKPTRENLHNCLASLAQDGVDLSQTLVNLHVFVGGTEFEHRYGATDFLLDPNSLHFTVT